VKQKHHVSIRRIVLLTLPFLLLLVIAYAAVQPPRLTQRGVGFLDLPIEYLVSLFLPTYTATFAVAVGLSLRRRLRRGEKILYPWIAFTRVIGCFVGVGLCLIAAYPLATGHVVTGSRVGDAGVIGMLGLLLAFPWRMVSVGWVWWSCFVMLGVYFVLPASVLVSISYLDLRSARTQPGTWVWLWASYAVVAFVGVQVFAVWRLRKRLLR